MKNSLILSVLAASLLGSAAHAGETYFGASYSALDLDTEFLGRTSTADLSAINVVVGNRFHKNFGIEGFYSFGVSEDSFDRELGNDVVSSTRFEIELDSAYGINALAYLPLSEQFELYGKVGYADFSFDDTDGDEADASGVFFGAGLNYRFNDNHFLFADYTVYTDGEYDDFAIDIDPTAFSIGYAINFF